MSSVFGSNLNDIRMKNRALILKLVATENRVSRVDLSRKTGLTKTTASKIVSDLIDEGIICETHVDTVENSVGRKPIYLGISKRSPLVCGLLIKRGLCSAIIADYKGNILSHQDYEYNYNLTSDRLVEILLELYSKLVTPPNRKVIAIGISSVGPIDTTLNQLANPPNFYGISNLPLPEILSRETGLPAFIINDANAGALAENVYGRAKGKGNLIYVHIMGGIGAGYILKNQIYDGTSGKSGEIGHTSINFSGPFCACGNVGCLEMYANMENVNSKINHMKQIYNVRSILPDTGKPYTWREVVDAAEASDFYAISALDEFCNYLSYALANAINLMDIQHVIVGYDSSPKETTVKKMLYKKLNSRTLTANHQEVSVEKSVFGGNAPLLGAVALITAQLFNGIWEF